MRVKQSYNRQNKHPQHAELSVGRFNSPFVKFNIRDNFKGKSKVARQYAYTQEPDDALQPRQHAVKHA